MIHLKSFEAIHYRGIDGLSLPSLSRANLITGINGVGKTALIEAIWLFTGRHNPGLLWNPNVQRSNYQGTNPVSELSGDLLELHGTENGKKRKWKVGFIPVNQVVQVGQVLQEFVGTNADNMQIPLAGHLDTRIDGKLLEKVQSMHQTPLGAVIYGLDPSPGRPSCIIEGTRRQLEITDEYLQRYSDMVREGRKEDLRNAINLILPRIEGVEILTDETGKSYLSVSTSTDRQLPLHALGGGVFRLFRLYLNFSAARNGMVLIDEIENGIHYSVLRGLWDRIRVWMHEWNVQFVATTHSAECIEAAMEAFADEPDELAIHKLYTEGESENVKAATFTGEALEGARNLNLEVR